MKQKLHYAWVILFALCMIRSLSAAGINNTAGLFLKPVADELGAGIGNLSISFSISSIATLLFMPFGGALIHKYSAKIVIFMAILLQAVSFILFGFIHSIWAWYLLAIPLGIGGAVLVNLIGPILVNRWFASNAGKALGIMMACAGLFGVFLQPICASLIADSGWRRTYVLLGVIILATVVLIDLLFIRSSPREMAMLPLGDTPDSKADTSKEGVSASFARKSKSFYLLVIFMIAITAFGAFNQHMATYGASLGYKSSYVGYVLSFGMVGSTIGAIVIGILSDKFGVVKATYVVVASILLSILCLFTSQFSFLIFALGAFLLGLGAMGIPVLAPLLTKYFFGEKEYEQIYSNVMVGPPLATILLLPLYGFIYDKTGSYLYVFLLLVVIVAAGAISIFIANRHHRKARNT